jgi:3-phenylpropionate/trans-cinnamate dioxygenase ferredoxin reductase subunit
MRDPETIVIVGGGLAGHTAAETLRREGFDGRVVLFAEESSRPYDRPPLSKEFLKGELDEEKLYFRPRDFYESQRIELRLGSRVEGLDAVRQLIFTSDAEPLQYDRLLIATGGYPRRLPVPGGDLRGIHYLRSLKDSARLGEALLPDARVVVVGAGFIGCEVAAAARARGAEVTMLEALPLPLAAAFGPEVGEFFAAEHRSHGVELRLGEGVSEFVGGVSVEGVISAKGETYACDAVVVGVGITPAVEFLKGTPVELDDGVLVDEYCRASVEHVYAAGDVANWWHPVLKRRLRVEHWDNAMKQGEAAALNMLGRAQPYWPVPYFWSDQYDLKLQLFGHLPKGEPHDHVMRGSYAERSFNLFYLSGRRVVAALGVNRFREARAAVKLIESGTEVELEKLADASVSIQSLSNDSHG